MNVEYYSKINSVADIRNRVNGLDKTLQWQETKPGETWHLISSVTQRVLETVTRGEFSQFIVGAEKHYQDVFNTLESAQSSGKFATIKNILRDDLGNRYIQ